MPEEMKHLELKTMLRTLSFLLALAALCFIVYMTVTERENPSYEDFQAFMADRTDKDRLKDVQLFVPDKVNPQCFGNCYNYWFIGYKGPWEKGTDEFYRSKWLGFCAETCRDNLNIVS